MLQHILFLQLRRSIIKIIAVILVIAAFCSIASAEFIEWEIKSCDTSDLLSEIISEDMTDNQKINAIYKWCYKKINYDYATAFTWQFSDKSKLPEIYTVDILNVIETRQGICLDQAALCSALLTSAGFRSCIAVCERGHHAVAALYYNNNWYALDTTRGIWAEKITDKITTAELADMTDGEYKLY